MGAQSLLTVKTPMEVTSVAALSDSLAMDLTVQVNEEIRKTRDERRLYGCFVRLFQRISVKKCRYLESQ